MEPNEQPQSDRGNNREFRAIEKEIKELRGELDAYRKKERTPVEVRVERLELIMEEWKAALFEETPTGRQKPTKFAQRLRERRR